MRKIFTAKVNALLAALVTVALSITLGAAVYIHMYRQLEYTRGQLAQARNDDFTPVYEARDYIEDLFVGDMEGYSPVESAVEGMVDGLGDRWSYYISPDEMAAYTENANNSYVGIGITVTKTEEGYIKVEQVTPGGGAEEAGIQVGDLIVAANGTDLVPLTLDECSTLIKGEENTFISLTVLKPDGTKVEVEAERRAVTIVVVSGQMIGNVGYIILDNFNAGSAEALIEMTEQFIDSGAEALVYDMRFNGGGRLVELVDILDYLLPEGTIFSCTDVDGKEYVYESDADCIELPMAVLINDSSYSAAEFFAAALREYDVAVTVGGATVGKGYAQNTYYLSDGSAIAISIYEYFTPNGVSLAGVGLTPDYPVDLSDDDYVALYYGQLAIEDDEQLQKALDVVFDGAPDA